MKNLYKYIFLILTLSLSLCFNKTAAQNYKLNEITDDPELMAEYHYKMANQNYSIKMGELKTHKSVRQNLINNQWVTTQYKYETYQDNLLRKRAFNDGWYFTYEYDSEGKIIKSWVRKREYSLYTYNSNNKLIEVLTYWITGVPQTKVTYEYDSNNFLITTIAEIWNGTSWQNSQKNLYTNNSNGQVLEIINQNWYLNDWVNFSRRLYTYNSSDLIDNIVRQNWVSNDWQNFIKYLYIYNTSELNTEYITQIWLNNTWQNRSKETYSYNEDDIIIEANGYTWVNNSWLHNMIETTTIIDGNFVGLLFPEDGKNYLPNTPVYIQWIGNGLDAVDIKFSSDNGVNWIDVASSVPDTGDYDFSWSIPANEYEQCKVRVIDVSNLNIYVENTEPFSRIYDYEFLTTNTGVVKLSVFSDGRIGDFPGEGFSFMNYPNALYSGGIIIGNNDNYAVGMVASFGFGDMVKSGIMPGFTSNENFNEISKASFKDSNAPTPYEVEVKQYTYANTDNPYIYYVYDVKNESASTINDFYIGMFADWDIGDYSINLGGYVQSDNLVYQYEFAGGQDPNFYGIVALSGMSGARVSTTGSRELIIEYMSTFLNDTITTIGDYRSFIGSGPFTIEPNNSQMVGFAILAGTDLNNLISNAQSAQQGWNSGIVDIEKDNYVRPKDFLLLQNYPNPFNPSTTIRFALKERSNVELTIYNLLGQKVSALVNEELDAGWFEVNFNANNLASGIYFYRLEAKSIVSDKHFTKVGKMLLLK